MSRSTSWVFPDDVAAAPRPPAGRAPRAPTPPGMPASPPAGRAAGNGPSRSGPQRPALAPAPKKPPRHRPDPPVHRQVTTSATPRCIQSRTGLRVGHARRPGTEIDADPGDALLAQAPGQPVEECVRRAVGGLTESAPYRGDRGGADEEVELQVSRCFAQMPSTPDLPGEDAIYFGVVQVAQRGGTDLARGMDDAGQRR